MWRKRRMSGVWSSRGERKSLIYANLGAGEDTGRNSRACTLLALGRRVHGARPKGRKGRRCSMRPTWRSIKTGTRRHATEIIYDVFQCDVCQLRKVNKSRPDWDMHQASDLGFILVSRAVDGGRKQDRAAARLGLEGSYGIPRGPFPVDDTWGIRIAYLSLGINARGIQHGTMRKTRLHFTNYCIRHHTHCEPPHLQARRGRLNDSQQTRRTDTS
jgi:hypothetical protein